MIWYHNETQIQLDDAAEGIALSDNKKFFVKENRYTLVVDNCGFEDSGEYKAVVMNSFGQVECKCRLNVIASELFDKNAPQFIELLKDLSVKKGQDGCFKCKVAGVPQPEVKWYKDGCLIKESNKIKVSALNIFDIIAF